MMFPKRGKQSSISKRLHVLDKVFSEYIRRRDADSNGICRCITCGKPGHWKEMDAGHFMSRNHKMIRFHEWNVNSQCKFCNRFQSGMQYEHGQAIDKKFGSGSAVYLQVMSKTHGKLTTEWIEFHIAKYRKIIKEMS